MAKYRPPADTGLEEHLDAPLKNPARMPVDPAPAPKPSGECPYCHELGGHDYSITHPADQVTE